MARPSLRPLPGLESRLEGQHIEEPLPDHEVDLLPGENPASSDREDIEHWLSVYEELAGFCDQLLSEAPPMKTSRRWSPIGAA